VVPQEHGDFSACRFWRQSFWEPAQPPAARVAIDKYLRQTEQKNQRSLQREQQRQQQLKSTTQAAGS
jgi:hypothetical protein